MFKAILSRKDLFGVKLIFRTVPQCVVIYMCVCTHVESLYRCPNAVLQYSHAQRKTD